MNQNIPFPEKEHYKKEDVKRLQERLLEMAKITTKILDDNNFSYILAFGSLLGAIRHEGFIPWDDDFDIFLFDEEYEEAVQCLRENLPEDIIVHDKKTDSVYWPAWSRLRDLNSKTTATLFPDDNHYKYTGINLDLYKLKKMKRSEVPAWKKKGAIEFLVRKHEVGVMPDDVYNAKFSEWTRDYVELLNNTVATEEDDEVYSAYNGTFPMAEIDDIFPRRKYKFEDTEFWGPNNGDGFLKVTSGDYGDYMQVPPYEKRRVHYDIVEFLEK